MIGSGKLWLLCCVLLERALARHVPEQPSGNDVLAKPLRPPVLPTNDDSELQWPSTSDDFFENPNLGNREDLFEGDILLTPEDRVLILERKATNPTSYWPEDPQGTVTVGYRFGDDVINQAKVKLGLDHWESHTCVRFTEVDSDEVTPHIKFVTGTSCSSYVGRASSATSGQSVTLGPGCVSSLSITVHEIGHALGFNHEQSRSDRDDYVKIASENVVSGKISNFNKRTTFNYGVPYDYGSVMHYAPRAFSTNGMNTILALDPMTQPLIGKGSGGLSFADKLMANIMYGCIDKWVGECSIPSDPCQNLGYTGSDCNCVCPEGTSGAQCEVLEDSFTDALIKLKTPYSEIITTEGVVSTPGYPTPTWTQAETYAKVLVAPDCYRVNLTITDLKVYGRNNADKCTKDYLNIRTSDEIGTETWYCGEEIAPGTVFLSETNTIVLDCRNRATHSRYRGFSGIIEHIPIDDCVLPVLDIINSGDIPLTKLTSSTGSCALSATSLPGSYELTSPGYPDNYATGDSCSVYLETSEPRYIRVVATEVKLSFLWEKIVLDSLFDSETSITKWQSGESYVFPSSALDISFHASAWWFGERFKLVIDVINSDCHQIVQVDGAAIGTLDMTNYAADTICEWWIQAPTGSEIQLDFSTFDVGQTDCSADYVAIDISGDESYTAATQQFCGSNSPASITSSGGQLNVLLNGIQGGDPGFTATYSIV